MSDGIFDKVSKENLDRAVSLLKSKLGEQDAAKVDAAMSDTKGLEKTVSGLGKKEQEMVIRILNDPKALNMLLSSPKVTQMVKGFLNKK